MASQSSMDIGGTLPPKVGQRRSSQWFTRTMHFETRGCRQGKRHTCRKQNSLGPPSNKKAELWIQMRKELATPLNTTAKWEQWSPQPSGSSGHP